MSTVFLFGAGFNQCVKNSNGQAPPLASNLFRLLLTNADYNAGSNHGCLMDCLRFVNRIWKKSESELKAENFDLEECLTYLQLKMRECEENNDWEEFGKLLDIEAKIEYLLIHFFEGFTSNPKEVLTSELQSMCSRILTKQPTILTFNYDCILENVLEITAESKKLTWDRLFSYGFVPDLVSSTTEKTLTWSDYSTGKTSIPQLNILKLHGSLNWYSPIEKSNGSYKLNTEKVRLSKNPIGSTSPQISIDERSHYLNPLIITPMLFKGTIYKQKPFPELWKQALQALQQCSSLTIIGYSFPQTDYAIKKVFLDAFEKNELHELTIVNPDTSIVQRV